MRKSTKGRKAGIREPKASKAREESCLREGGSPTSVSRQHLIAGPTRPLGAGGGGGLWKGMSAAGKGRRPGESSPDSLRKSVFTGAEIRWSFGLFVEVLLFLFLFCQQSINPLGKFTA